MSKRLGVSQQDNAVHSASPPSLFNIDKDRRRMMQAGGQTLHCSAERHTKRGVTDVKCRSCVRSHYANIASVVGN